MAATMLRPTAIIPALAMAGAEFGRCPLDVSANDIHDPLRDNDDLFNGSAFQGPDHRF